MELSQKHTSRCHYQSGIWAKYREMIASIYVKMCNFCNAFLQALMCCFYNKLKSLKVAQVKDEMDDDEDDGCDSV